VTAVDGEPRIRTRTRRVSAGVAYFSMPFVVFGLVVLRAWAMSNQNNPIALALAASGGAIVAALPVAAAGQADRAPPPKSAWTSPSTFPIRPGLTSWSDQV